LIKQVRVLPNPKTLFGKHYFVTKCPGSVILKITEPEHIVFWGKNFAAKLCCGAVFSPKHYVFRLTNWNQFVNFALQSNGSNGNKGGGAKLVLFRENLNKYYVFIFQHKEFIKIKIFSVILFIKF